MFIVAVAGWSLAAARGDNALDGTAVDARSPFLVLSLKTARCPRPPSSFFHPIESAMSNCWIEDAAVTQSELASPGHQRQRTARPRSFVPSEEEICYGMRGSMETVINCQHTNAGSVRLLIVSIAETSMSLTGSVVLRTEERAGSGGTPDMADT